MAASLTDSRLLQGKLIKDRDLIQETFFMAMSSSTGLPFPFRFYAIWLEGVTLSEHIPLYLHLSTSRALPMATTR